ncbi:MAG: hypothetical protein N2662_01045 [Bacteroidales bacterium]|nr:hypothetical protein [Bacteroidales bacterium]
MIGISVLKKRLEKNPLNHELWCKLGSEYHKKSLNKEALKAYYTAVDALIQIIYLRLPNTFDNLFFDNDTLGLKAFHTFWFERLVLCTIRNAEQEGVRSLIYPNAYSAIKLCDKEKYGGLLYMDRDSERLILPNLVNSVAHYLSENSIYSNYLRLIGYFYLEFGYRGKASEFLSEANVFDPFGYRMVINPISADELHKTRFELVLIKKFLMTKEEHNN